MSFPAILVLATFLTGLIWALDTLFLAPQRREKAAAASQKGDIEGAEKACREPLLVEYSRSFFPIILVVLLVRSFMVEPFRIPSGSMMPTLVDGDFILVNKFSYGLRLPVLNTKFLELGDPQRGDIVVFRYPEDPRVDYIKRVVGLPGDQVSYVNKVLYVNGKMVPQELAGNYVGKGAGTLMTGASLRNEQLGDTKHQILVIPNSNDHPVEFTVPQGEYFVMGDNRDNSRDSRFWGTVPEANLVGKAFFIWMNWDGGIDWKRIGSQIQ